MVTLHMDGQANFTVKYKMRENKAGKGREYSKHNVFPSLFFVNLLKVVDM